MTVRVGINGYGRIGRSFHRALLDRGESAGVELVAVNDPFGDSETMAFLLKHDSVGGTLRNEVKVSNGGFSVDGKEIKKLEERDPAEIPWGEVRPYGWVAREIGSRHLAPLEHHKITVQMGRDLSLSQAIQLDQLVGARLRRAMDPLSDVEGYLKSQKGGANFNYRRPDVQDSAIGNQASGSKVP